MPTPSSSRLITPPPAPPLHPSSLTRHSVRRRYQRGIYQPETFKRESKYGLTVLTTTDEGLLHYLKQVRVPRPIRVSFVFSNIPRKINQRLSQVMSQMSQWLTEDSVQRLVVVVSGVDSGETLERWQVRDDIRKKR